MEFFVTDYDELIQPKYYETLEAAQKYAFSRIADHRETMKSITEMLGEDSATVERWAEKVMSIKIGIVMFAVQETGYTVGNYELVEVTPQQTLRLDKRGIDVTDLPGLHSEDDTCWVRVETS